MRNTARLPGSLSGQALVGAWAGENCRPLYYRPPGQEGNAALAHVRYRALKPEDVPFLEQLAKDSGFPYPNLDHPHVEAIVVVVDSSDKPVMACAAKRLVELYLYVDPKQHPAVKMDALKILHHAMAKALRDLRYTEVNVSIPPVIEKSFGRRMERTFGWAKSRWQSWFLHF